VWASLGVITAGFGAVLLGWSVVAGTDDASGQVAPAVGFGVGGLVTIGVGTALLVVSVARRDQVLLDRVLRAGAGRARARPRTVGDRAADAVLVVVAALGIAWMALGAHGAAGEDQVEFARPYLVSGGLGGLGIVIVALGVLLTRTRRRSALRAAVEGSAP
jgi:hypothetical protein